MKKLILLILAIIISSCGVNSSCDIKSKNETYKSREFSFSYSVDVEPSNNKKLEMWLPVPQSNSVQEISNVSIDSDGLSYEFKVEKDHNNKKLPILLFAVIVVLLGVSLYFISEKNKASNEKDEIASQLAEIEKVKDAELASKKAELEKILADFEKIKAERANMNANSKSLNNEIDLLRNQISSLNYALSSAKKEVREAKENSPKESPNTASSTGKVNTSPRPKAKRLTAADKARYAQQMEDLITTHKAALAQRDKEIKRLKHINRKLHGEVNRLVKNQGKLANNIHSLEDRISIASQLYIENMKVGYMTTKGTVEYDELNEFKAKKIDKLKVGFLISDNKVSEKGLKNFKLKLVDPSGKVLFESGKGGSFDVENGTEFYTKEKEVKFDNDEEQVNFFYIQSDDYAIGEYQAIVFAENKKVGEKRFSIL